ncbi:MAG: hypothetical protein AAGD25_41215 [Cyanobacteria bacterium P01_F01_bin.150]
MSLPKKGSKKIHVNGSDYRWLGSKWNKVSDWRADREFVDEEFLAIAQKFGLGDTADVYFNLVIEKHENPVSKIAVKYFGKVIDGFLGIEQFTQIKPSLVSKVIGQALESGWNPDQKGDFALEIYENSGEKHRPAVLALPGLNDEVKNYEKIIKPIQIV